MTKVPPGPRKGPVRAPARASGHVDPRIPAAGTTLTREWHGKVNRLVVLEDGRFQLGHAIYGSLSAAAEAVTGLQWNGFQFWGLIPYSRRGRSGRSTDELAAEYSKAADLYNAAARQLARPRKLGEPLPERAWRLLPADLVALLGGDADTGRLAAGELHAAAARLRQVAGALEDAANAIEMRHGRAEVVNG